MKHLVPTEDPSLARDPLNHALLNTNVEALRLYRITRESKRDAASMDARINKLETELSSVRTSLELIIELLQKNK